MARRTVTPVKDAKSKAFELFKQGKTPSSPELKELGLAPSTRWNYYALWKKKTIRESQENPQVETQVEAQVEAQVESQAQDEAIATCPVCSQPFPRKQLLKHMWDNHHDYMLEQSRKGGQSSHAKKVEAKVTTKTAKTKAKAGTTTMETTLPGGESVSGIEEHETTSETTPTSDDKKKPKVEGVSDEFVEGEALWVKAKISVKTLTYYQLTAFRIRSQNHETILTLGDFFDLCVDDYFKGRNLSLGLVKLGEKEK